MNNAYANGQPQISSNQYARAGRAEICLRTKEGVHVRPLASDSSSPVIRSRLKTLERHSNEYYKKWNRLKAKATKMVLASWEVADLHYSNGKEVRVFRDPKTPTLYAEILAHRPHDCSFFALQPNGRLSLGDEGPWTVAQAREMATVAEALRILRESDEKKTIQAALKVIDRLRWKYAHVSSFAAWGLATEFLTAPLAP